MTSDDELDLLSSETNITAATEDAPHLQESTTAFPEDIFSAQDDDHAPSFSTTETACQGDLEQASEHVEEIECSTPSPIEADPVDRISKKGCSLNALLRETQRLKRESANKLPYHTPKSMNLKDFLNRKQQNKAEPTSLQLSLYPERTTPGCLINSNATECENLKPLSKEAPRIIDLSDTPSKSRVQLLMDRFVRHTTVVKPKKDESAKLILNSSHLADASSSTDPKSDICVRLGPSPDKSHRHMLMLKDKLLQKIKEKRLQEFEERKRQYKEINNLDDDYDENNSNCSESEEDFGDAENDSDEDSEDGNSNISEDVEPVENNSNEVDSEKISVKNATVLPTTSSPQDSPEGHEKPAMEARAPTTFGDACFPALSVLHSKVVPFPFEETQDLLRAAGADAIPLETEVAPSATKKVLLPFEHTQDLLCIDDEELPTVNKLALPCTQLLFDDQGSTSSQGFANDLRTNVCSDVAEDGDITNQSLKLSLDDETQDESVNNEDDLTAFVSSGPNDELLALCSGRFGTNAYENAETDLRSRPSSDRGSDDGNSESELDEREEEKLEENSDNEQNLGSEYAEGEDSDNEELALAKRYREEKEMMSSFYSQDNRHTKRKSTFFDEEAELSGSDVDPDEKDDEEEGSDLDQYEVEEGDLDMLPSEDKLREEVGRIHLKRMLDDDKRRLLLYKEAYLEGGDLHTGSTRLRKFRWKKDDSTVFADMPDAEDDNMLSSTANFQDVSNMHKATKKQGDLEDEEGAEEVDSDTENGCLNSSQSQFQKMAELFTRKVSSCGPNSLLQNTNEFGMPLPHDVQKLSQARDSFLRKDGKSLIRLAQQTGLVSVSAVKKCVFSRVSPEKDKEKSGLPKKKFKGGFMNNTNLSGDCASAIEQSASFEDMPNAEPADVSQPMKKQPFKLVSRTSKSEALNNASASSSGGLFDLL